MYARALQHLLTGIYLGEVCLIGLFAIRAAIGPLVIMALFTILTILAHMSLNDALVPLHSALPRSLEAEEENMQSKEDAQLLYTQREGSRLAAFWKWFHPNMYRDFASLRRKVRRDHMEINYSDMQMRDAYYEPCVTSPMPKLWIPRDRWGFSQQEILETHPSIPITDERAHLSEKNKIIWDKFDPHVPLWELKVLY